jgi:hypothetical protein
MDKVTDWAELISNRICESVYAYLAYTTGCAAAVNYEATENALECVLSSSCAGPESIRRARVKLALINDEVKA